MGRDPPLCGVGRGQVSGHHVPWSGMAHAPNYHQPLRTLRVVKRKRNAEGKERETTEKGFRNLKVSFPCEWCWQDFSGQSAARRRTRMCDHHHSLPPKLSSQATSFVADWNKMSWAVDLAFECSSRPFVPYKLPDLIDWCKNAKTYQDQW